MPTIINPTTCRYFALDAHGNVTSPQRDFAWPDAADRYGDGEAELEAFLECSRNNVHELTPRPDVLASGSDIDNYTIRVWEYRFSSVDEPTLFGLAVVDATGYWDTDTETWVEVAR
jgi:hypothetical protein